jgi:acetyl esterase/lipase
MDRLERRDFLALGGSLLLAQATGLTQAVAAESSSPAAPPVPKALPKAWTKAPTIPLWPGEPPGGAGYRPQKLPANMNPTWIRNIARPELHVFRPSKSNGHALLVMPGGAYLFVSIGNEGVDVAKRMNALGTTVFVLTYRLPNEGWTPRADVPLQDAQRAMRLIRAQAGKYRISPDTLSAIGFSAGGNLAACLATQHAEKVYTAVDAADSLSAKPFAAGLIYPVVTMEKPWTHDLSRRMLLGDHPTDAEVAHRSAERQVTADTPPTFLAHAMDDTDVPVENSIHMMEALRKAKRPVEAHFFQEGHHAFGVGRPNTPSAQWIDLFHAWHMRLINTTPAH